MTERSPLALLEKPWVAPAIAAIAFGAFAIKNAVSPAIDQDPFWLASAGRLALATGHVPHENAFSFTAEHAPWICHELGFAVLYAEGFARLGAAFSAIVGVLSAATTLGIVTAFVARETTHRLALAFVSLVLLVGIPLFYAPPAFVSLGVVAGMTALAFSGWFGWRRAAACVALEWLWAQLHGSFPLGVVILIVSAIDDARGRREKLVAAGAGGLATLANPYGLALHGLVATYASGNAAVAKVIHEHIREFLPIWASPPAFGPFDVPALAIVTALALAALARRGERVRGAFVLALCVLAALHARHLLLALVIGSMLLARRFDALLPPVSDERARPRVALGIVLPGALVATAAWAFMVATHPRSFWLGKNLGGPDAIAMIDELPNDAHVYAPFGVAPVVTWYAFPRGVRVLYDPRNDCYPADVALAALPLEYDEAAQRGAAATVTRLGAGFAFARTGSAVEASFRAAPDWHPIGARGGLALFARK